MTIVRALDSDHDWTFGKGRNDYKKNKEAVAQSIKTRLLSFLGDCFFDVSAGVDWFNLLGGKDKISLELAISTTILNTPDVEELKNLSVVENLDRKLTVSYEVITSFGDVNNSFDFDLI